MPFLFGLFYEFTSYIAQIFILIFLLIKIYKEKKIKIFVNISTISLIVLSTVYLLTCMYGIDKGMSFLGFLKFLVPSTFAVLLMQYKKEDLKEMTKFIPLSGIVMIIASALFRYIPFLPNEFYLPNGRISGFFQYSNTFALFLLIGIIYLVNAEKSKIKVIIGSCILLIGIMLSGSRAVFILTIINLIIIIIKNKQYRKDFIGLGSIVILGTIVYVLITKNVNTIGRYLTTSVTSSTLLGRILYYKDAIMVILTHPFGLGYMGYSYIEPQIQTGIYNILYVHNEILQIALDVGIIPMVVFVVAILKNLINKEKFNISKQILLTIILHALIDMDLQFIYIFMILVTTLDLYHGKEYEYDVNFKILTPIILSIVAIYTYFGLATFLNYINKNEIASKMYPIYTEANLRLAYEYSKKDEEKADKIATNILETNKYSDLVYNIKALYYMNKQNWQMMLKYKEKVLDLEKYEISNYEEYVLMLSKAIEYYASKDEMEKAMEYVKLVTEVPQRIEKIKNSTSSISYMLRDVPNFTLRENIQEYIEKMKGVFENE